MKMIIGEITLAELNEVTVIAIIVIVVIAIYLPCFFWSKRNPQPNDDKSIMFGIGGFLIYRLYRYLRSKMNLRDAAQDSKDYWDKIRDDEQKQ